MHDISFSCLSMHSKLHGLSYAEVLHVRLVSACSCCKKIGRCNLNYKQGTTEVRFVSRYQGTAISLHCNVCVRAFVPLEHQRVGLNDAEALTPVQLSSSMR